MRMVKRKRWFIWAFLSLAICFSEMGSEAAEKSFGRASGTTEALRIAVFPGTITALPYIAEDRGFFERHGLKPSLTLYDAGIMAMEDLLADKIEIAAVMEYPFAIGRVKTDDLRIISSIAATNNLELIMRTDRAVGRPSDCRGKKIGLARGTFAEFFLAVFFSFNGLRLSDVTIVDLKPSEMEGAITRGTVDGVIVWQPFVHTIKQEMEKKVVSWPAQGSQDSYALLVAKEAYIRSRPDVIERLLRALLDAQQYTKQYAADAQDILKKRFGYGSPFLHLSWSQNRLEVKLTQDLLILMEDEARWAIENKISQARRTPNFLKNIYLDALEKIKPEAVTIIH